nr:MAG TPA: hypothetical protein [Caudoviricetes sp.]
MRGIEITETLLILMDGDRCESVAVFIEWQHSYL